MRKSNGEGESVEELKAFLGEGTEFKGVLSFTGTVRIDGNFEGEIITKDTLIVGESAVLNADVSVGTLIAKGHIRGNISATKKIDIRVKSEVIGNIKTSVLVIEEGSIFEGQCEMTAKEGTEAVNDYGKVKEGDLIVVSNAAVPV